MSGPFTTAIVVSYRTGPRLHECLYALAYDPAVSKLIVVDNGNPEDETAWLRAFAEKRDHVTLVEPGANLGFGAGVNLAARDALEGDLLIINPDAVLKRGSIEAMRTAAKGLDQPWIIGGKIFDERGTELRGPRRRKLTLFRAMTRYIGWNTWTLEHTAPPDGPVPMDVVSGALMFISKSGFDQLNGFDEDYFLHVEDVDICRRAWDAGGCVRYCPTAGALHYGSTSEAPSKTVARHKANSLILYFRKFASNPFEKVLINLLAPVIRMGAQARTKD
ncbi:glycosyltransferase family 2 protein [Henriciella sp. AS95]|uniref:glycosyltransferase family 2 protein n=1 Tax=Henriciella sp. AS95 TaxID=3135782 RepID=UPI00317DAC05